VRVFARDGRWLRHEAQGNGDPVLLTFTDSVEAA
jgi:hypothetical protein